MKQIDNRQKQQAQLRAQATRSTPGRFGGSGPVRKKGHSEHSSLVAHEIQDVIEEGKTERVETPPRVDVGRNDPCPCGSGKKYKKCHWGKEIPSK